MHTRKVKHEVAQARSEEPESTEVSSKNPRRLRLGQRLDSVAAVLLLMVITIVAFVADVQLHQIPTSHSTLTTASTTTTTTTTTSETEKLSNVRRGQSTTNADNNIPECAASPWKADENLVGACPGALKPISGIANPADCAKSCCDKGNDCILWQFRRDVGCTHGAGDARLGMEKDGPATWCSDKPPVRWKGQYLLKRDRGVIIENRREQACNTATWDPEEQPGQCFGLGDVRPGAPSSSALACREACCASGMGDTVDGTEGSDKKKGEVCGAWQWEASLGCFFGPRMFSCAKSDDPVVFEPFIGRRKLQLGRSYTAF